MDRLFPATLSILLSLALLSGCAIRNTKSESKPISHDIWSELLRDNVKESGRVDYKGFIKQKDKLYQYLELLNQNHPNEQYWSKEEQLAYWINAYNAYTVQLIVEHYPVASIKDIKKGIPFVNSVWDKKFIRIESKKYDLTKIEHGILRKQFNEPRIHFAINCASISCPNLREEAYLPNRLEEQLTDAAKLFLSDASKNKISARKVKLSKIFSWFGGDFKKEGTLIEYINQYAPTPISHNAEKSFLDYNWSLNE